MEVKAAEEEVALMVDPPVVEEEDMAEVLLSEVDMEEVLQATMMALQSEENTEDLLEAMPTEERLSEDMEEKQLSEDLETGDMEKEKMVEMADMEAQVQVDTAVDPPEDMEVVKTMEVSK